LIEPGGRGCEGKEENEEEEEEEEEEEMEEEMEEKRKEKVKRGCGEGGREQKGCMEMVRDSKKSAVSPSPRRASS
jgi:hypothetical protein